MSKREREKERGPSTIECLDLAAIESPFNFAKRDRPPHVAILPAVTIKRAENDGDGKEEVSRFVETKKKNGKRNKS